MKMNHVWAVLLLVLVAFSTQALSREFPEENTATTIQAIDTLPGTPLNDSEVTLLESRSHVDHVRAGSSVNETAHVISILSIILIIVLML